MFPKLTSISGVIALASSVWLIAAPIGCGSNEGESSSSKGGSAGADGGSGKAGTSGGGAAAGAGAGGTSGGAVNGTPCAGADACASGFCVDGVCCDVPCDTACWSCAIAGTEGKCSTFAAETDPDGDCVGIGENGAACGGTCDGDGACAFADVSTKCGDATCVDAKQTEYRCDGFGSCIGNETECGDYVCDATSCKTSCAGAADCSTSAWCNGTKCEPKKTNGSACGGAEQCLSNLCEGQYCCSTACATPASCSTGDCLCGGVSCSAGKACILYFLDQDADGFGATSTYNKPGCEGQPPSDPGGKTYYPATAPADCDDTNTDVHPGQTDWFVYPYGTDKWDYDCDGVVEKRYAEGISANSCSTCCETSLCPICSAGNWYLGGCATKTVEGFATSKNCGSLGPLKSCSNLCQAMTGSDAKQACH